MCRPDEPVEKYLAHSARPELGIPAQGYFEHANDVLEFCQEEFKVILNNRRKNGCLPLFELWAKRLLWAARYHDLGKLNDENQKVLRGERKAKHLPVNHCDAGALYMMLNKSELSALLIYSHHAGLPDMGAEGVKRGWNGGDARFRDENEMVRGDSCQNLETYLERHDRSWLPQAEGIKKILLKGEPAYKTVPRVLLSFLVDADHTDTAIHYRSYTEEKMPFLRAEERLASLDKYIANLGNKGQVKTNRNKARDMMYLSCRDAPTNLRISCCEGPVGIGKTTAVMAHLLRVAADNHLRRIFIILPFTNILDQSVEVYRKAIKLPDESDEDMKRVVAAIHHKAEYDDENSRQLSVLWRSPIIVTTAVQFFETMAAASPSALRKLHALPDSAVFIDEAHTALPMNLWPLAWIWLKEYSDVWNCHFVLASGSLTKFWEFDEFKDGTKFDIVPSILPETFSKEINTMESLRVKYKRKIGKMNEQELCAWLLSLKGPRLVILNTVQSAAVIANTLSKLCGRNKVEHISTALAPNDRARTVKIVRERLQNRDDDDWTLVATSCVEAGVDFSFRNGIREAAGLVNLLQIAGRIRRNDESWYKESTVWSVELDFSGLLKPHPVFDIPSKILARLFEKNPDLLNSDTNISELCTDSLRQELNEYGNTPGMSIIDDERAGSYRVVEQKFKVIDNRSVTVIINEETKARLEAFEKVSWSELQDNSVQIYAFTAAKLGVQEIKGHAGIFFWPYFYDEFIGYMAGALENKKIDREGCCFV